MKLTEKNILFFIIIYFLFIFQVDILTQIYIGWQKTLEIPNIHYQSYVWNN